MANLFLRVPDDLKALLDARADSKKQTTNALANEILRQYLQGSDSDLQATVKDLVERMAALESKMQSALIAKQTPPPAKPNPPPPASPAPRTAPPVASYSAAPPGGHPRADGGRWLTTGDAARVAAERGGPGNHGTLKRWGAREPEKLEAIGLRYCPHGTKNNALASFEDLRYQPPE